MFNNYTSSYALHPPTSYSRVPVRTLRALPIRENPRLTLLDYRLTCAPGMTGKPRTHGHGAARMAGGYVLSLCVTQDAGQWYLEVQSAPYDEEADRREPLDCSLLILADLYRAVQTKQIAAEGRAYGKAGSRN